MQPFNPNIDTIEFPLLTIFGQQTWRPGIGKHPRLSKKNICDNQEQLAVCQTDQNEESEPSSSDVDADEDGEPIVTTGWRKACVYYTLLFFFEKKDIKFFISLYFFETYYFAIEEERSMRECISKTILSFYIRDSGQKLECPQSFLMGIRNAGSIVLSYCLQSH